MRPRPTRALILAASLAVCGCATHEDLRTYSYEYAGHGRLAAERRAAQDMQDSCYFSGYQRFEVAGPPQIVNDGGATDGQVRVTQSFYCVGTVGGP